MEVEKIAIVKPIKIRTGNLAGLRAVISYIKSDMKTQKGELVACKDMLRGKEFEQMLITKNMHIHYIINSVSTQKGEKWQCSPKDLEKMRSISDELCQEHGLSVIGNRGNSNMNYGEYKSDLSWKQQLAKDIASSVKESFSVEDFYHNLNSRGIDCSFGQRNIMFKVCNGYCGLEEERLCSNYKLMSYGDFSRNNILNSITYNDYNLQKGLRDIHQGGELFEELTRFDFGGAGRGEIDTTSLYKAIVQEIEFHGKPWYQIQSIIAQLQADQVKRQLEREGCKALQERMMQNSQSILIPSICDLVEEFHQWKYQRELENYDLYQEHDLYEMWEL